MNLPESPEEEFRKSHDLCGLPAGTFKKAGASDWNERLLQPCHCPGVGSKNQSGPNDGEEEGDEPPKAGDPDLMIRFAGSKLAGHEVVVVKGVIA